MITPKMITPKMITPNMITPKMITTQVKINLILIFLIVFSYGCASQNINPDLNPKEITSSVIEIKISGNLHISEGIDSITYIQKFPVECENQKILSVTSTPRHEITVDEDKNREIVLKWDSINTDVLEYEINIKIEKTIFPIDSVDPKVFNEKEYLYNNNSLTEWNDEIKNKAAEILADNDNDNDNFNNNNFNNNLLKAALISQWIYKNIKYDLEFSDVEKDAVWVFENKKGVCDEFSHLFISMARSQGIPARSVSGIAYDGKKWVKHSWAEIYHEGMWFSYDPTYNEGSIVDATHIIFTRDVDNGRFNEYIYWHGTSQKETNKDAVRSEKKEAVTFLKINKTKILDTKFYFLDDEISENANISGVIEIKNSVDAPLVGTFEIIAADNINYLNNSSGIFYIKPYEKTNLRLNFEVSKITNETKTGYVFPLTINTFPYSTAETNLSVSKKMIIGLHILIGNETRIKSNESIIGILIREIKLNTNVKNLDPVEKEFVVDACLKNKKGEYIGQNTGGSCKRKIMNIDKNSNISVDFSFDAPEGDYTFFVKAHSNGNSDECAQEVNVKIDESVNIPGIGKLTIYEILIGVIGFLLAAVAIAAVFLIKERGGY